MKFWYIGLKYLLIPLKGNSFGGMCGVVVTCNGHTADEVKKATNARTVLPLTPESAARLCGRDTIEWAESQGRSICPVCM